MNLSTIHFLKTQPSAAKIWGLGWAIFCFSK